jgi:hypothetical protein
MKKFAAAPLAGVEGAGYSHPITPERAFVSWLHLSPRLLGVISCCVIIALAFFVPWHSFCPRHWDWDPLGSSAPYPLPDLLSAVLWDMAAVLALVGAVVFKWTPPTD